MTIFFGWNADKGMSNYDAFAGEWTLTDWRDGKRIRVVPDGFPAEGDVLFASYGHGSYCGDAVVFFRRGADLFVNEASHCSCNGFDGQWDPKPVPAAYIVNLAKAIADEKRRGYGPLSDHEPEALAALLALASTMVSP